MFSKFGKVAGALLLTSPLVLAQWSFPDCVSQCIDQSTDDSCSLTDVKCICRQSNGNFLPDLVTCMKGACDNSLSVDDLLNPMELTCRLIGTPISESALDNARNINSASPITTTVYTASPAVTTVTTTEDDGATVVLTYPITVRPDEGGDEEGQSTITRFPPGTTVTQTLSSGRATASLAPLIIVSIDDDGNTHTSTSTRVDSSSTDNEAQTTSTVTSGASTVTAETTATATPASSGTQSADTTTTITRGATSSAAGNAASSQGGPFSQQPEGAAPRSGPAAGLSLTIALLVAGLFY